MAKTIALVSCVSEKLGHPAPARDLYRSPWFIKAARYADRLADDWMVLSAEHGLVHKNTVIAPYEKTLNTLSVSERRLWAARVLQSLRGELSAGDTVVVLAGKCYREYVAPAISSWGCRLEVPMEGLRIGEQLSWLNRHIGRHGVD